MILFKSKLSKKDQIKVGDIIQSYPDFYGDFYITKDNLRLYIKENIELLFKCLNKGDKIAYTENGVAIVTGFSDKNNRKYIKFLTKDLKIAENLLKSLSWNLDCDLWIKIKKNNPIKNILRVNGFMFHAGRGKELLLVRRNRAKFIPKKTNLNTGEKNVRRN